MYFYLEHWHWWVLSLIFVVTMAVFRHPIHFILTLATSAIGLLAWLQPEVPAKIQLLLFGIVVGVGLVIAQFFSKNSDSGTTVTDPNFVDLEDSNAAKVVGRTFTLDTPIVNGIGMISFDDQTWKLRGEDAEVGTKIRIESVDGIDNTFLEIRVIK